MMKKRFKFRIKFRNKFEENFFKISIYFIVGVLILFFVFKISSFINYIQFLILILILALFNKYEWLNYGYGGALLAYLVYNLIGFALSTNLPIVVVVSSSMQHDNPEKTFYGWLENNLGYNRTFIDSWSFNNGFSVGDMPIIMGSKNYNIGDVIVYDANQPAPIIHRIIKINPDGTYQTKGDNNLGQLEFEKNISKEQIKGKVIFIIPKLGYIKIGLMKLLGEYW
jgi:hypothetical protein